MSGISGNDFIEMGDTPESYINNIGGLYVGYQKCDIFGYFILIVIE